MLQQYYVKILSEAEASIAYLQAQKNNRLNFNKQGIKALNILRSKNKDSLSALLESLGVLKEMRSLAPSFPIIEEFLSQGYLSRITNDSVKSGFHEFSEMYKFIGLVDNYTINQYQLQIEPYLNLNFNYKDIAGAGYEAIAIAGGPSSNTENIWEDLQLWNLISNKLETWEYEKGAIDWGIYVMEDLKRLIEKELIDD